jgi:predicted transposase/invertase (TIGR01784 family)
VALLEMLQKHIMRRDLLSALHNIAEVFIIAHKNNLSHDIITIAINYLATHYEEDEIQELFNLVEEKLPEYKKSITMTYADSLIKRGIQQGVQQGKIELAANLLKHNVPVETIARASGLNIDEIKNFIESYNAAKQKNS